MKLRTHRDFTDSVVDHIRFLSSSTVAVELSGVKLAFQSCRYDSFGQLYRLETLSDNKSTTTAATTTAATTAATNKDCNKKLFHTVSQQCCKQLG